MQRKIISRIPGFRSGRLWKKLLAIVCYFVSLVIILILLSMSNKFTDSPHDDAIVRIQNILTIVIVFILPFLLVSNLWGIRGRLPLLRANRFWVRSMGHLTISILLLIGLFSVFGWSSQAFSPEYVKKEAANREEQKLLKEQEAAQSAKIKEEKQKAKEDEQLKLAAQKAEEKEKKESEKQAKEVAEKQAAQLEKEQKEKEKLAAAAEKQKEEDKKAEEQKKSQEEARQAELAVEKEAKEQVQAEESPTLSEINVMEGYYLIQTDGFTLQVPTDWHSVDSHFTKSLESRFSTDLEVDDTPIKETYNINFKTDMQFSSEIEIIQYDKNQGYEKFAKSKGYGAFTDGFKKIEFTGADAAFEWIDYKDSVAQHSSRELIVFKNDVCYIFYSYHEVMNTQGSWADIARKDIKKFRADLEVIYDSFQLVDPNITFSDVVQSEYKM